MKRGHSTYFNFMGNDACILTFNFLPSSFNSIKFQNIFSSAIQDLFGYLHLNCHTDVQILCVIKKIMLNVHVHLIILCCQMFRKKKIDKICLCGVNFGEYMCYTISIRHSKIHYLLGVCSLHKTAHGYFFIKLTCNKINQCWLILLQCKGHQKRKNVAKFNLSNNSMHAGEKLN